MPVKFYCDRCGADVTDTRHGAINGVPDAGDNGDGEVVTSFDYLCQGCYQAILDFASRTLDVRQAVKDGFYAGYTVAVREVPPGQPLAAWNDSSIRRELDEKPEADRG